MRVWLYEFTLALRRLWRRRVQTTLLLATFSVSITLSLLSWSLYYTIVFKQPDYDPAGSLCMVNLFTTTRAWRKIELTREDIRTWQAANGITDLTPIGFYRSVFVATKSSAQRHLGGLLSTHALQLLGAKPLLGRLFTPDEDKFKCAPVMLISERLWRGRFEADPHIVGTVVKVDGYATTIVGVMPEAFRFPNNQDVWLPIGFNTWEWEWPDDNTFDGLARLKPGYPIERATEELRMILERRGPGTIAAKYNLRPLITPVREFNLFPYMHESALILLVLSLVFVLVSCANAANLVMIDFFGRTAELAASMSLGVPRAAAIRAIFFQLVIIAAISALIAIAVLLVAAPAVHGAFALMVAPYWLTFSFAWHHVVVVAGLAAASVGVAIIVPAVYLLVASPDQIIRDGAGTTRGTGRTLWRRTLLMGQIALLTVLGIAAGLLMQSNRTLGEDHWGYDASRTFLGKLDVPKVDFPTQPARLALFRKVAAEVARIPGMRNAGLTDQPPGYSGQAASTRYARDLKTFDEGREDGRALAGCITEGFLDALNIPLVAGEPLPPTWKEGDPLYIILNQSLAARLWPQANPLGQALYVRFRWTEPKEPSVKVIVRGVARDFQAAGPQTTNNDFIYLQFASWTPNALFLVAGGRNALPSTKEINDAVWRVDPRVVPYFPDSIKHQIDMQLGFVRLTTRLTTIFAFAAVMLCAVGVYSITVSQVLQRNREFGIRLALGIEPVRLWLRFIRGHLGLAAAGVLIGLVAAYAAMHTLKTLLYGVAERDPVTFASVAVLILFVSALANIPSFFRLRRINPAECLRSL